MRRLLPFQPLAPALVVILGVAVAAILAALGVRQLREQGEAAASLRSELLATSVAERLRATPADQRPLVMERAASRSGAEFLLVDARGTVLVDASLGPPPTAALSRLLLEQAGTTESGLGRVRYSATSLGAPLQHLSLLCFVRAPEAPFASGSLLGSVAALAALLVGAAGLVAFALARDVDEDLVYVGTRITAMAREGPDPAGRAIPVRSLDHVGMLTAAFDDLVERFAAAEQAYRQDLAGANAYDRERSAFLAALSHELRTPLNTVLGFADVLLAEVDGPLSPDARENLEIVRSSGEHLRALVDDILELSRLESGEQRLEKDDVDVFTVAEEVVREAGLAAQNKPVAVTLSGGAAPAWLDARKLRRVLQNVIGNAVKFTARGSVRTHVEPRGNDVVVEVVDTGPGIAAAEQAAIFDEYRQAGDLAARRVGTGLGLAIARRLVRMHGGDIALESEVGRGSRFVITLPAHNLGPEPRLTGHPRASVPSIPREVIS